MAWYRGTGKKNHKSVFENVSHDRCIFCGDDRTEIARTDFTIMFSPEVCAEMVHWNHCGIMRGGTPSQSGVRHAEIAAQFLHRYTGFMFFQNPDNLFVCKSMFH